MHPTSHLLSQPVTWLQLIHFPIPYATSSLNFISPLRAMAETAMNGGQFNHQNTTPPKTERVLPLFSLQGKTAIVSGAGAGIGLAVAQGFAEAGANVAIWYNSNKKALDRSKEIETTYGVQCMSDHSSFCTCNSVAERFRQGVPGRCHQFRPGRSLHQPNCQGVQRPPRHLRRQLRYTLDSRAHHGRNN